MSIGAHLVELRKRLLVAALAIIIASVGGFFLADFVVAALRAPIEEVAAAPGRRAGLNFTVVTQAFDLKIQIALTFGAVVSSPVWLYQVWGNYSGRGLSPSGGQRIWPVVKRPMGSSSWMTAL